MPIATFPITLIDSYMITPHVKHFKFKTLASTPFIFLPGQFINIHWELEGKSLKRSYSIANPPGNDNYIEFAASYVEDGPGTKYLFNLSNNTIVQASGPFGRLLLKQDIPKRYILVATSTGVTPYRAMLNELEKRLALNPNLTILILQGVQKKEDVLYNQDFRFFEQKHPRFTFLPCFSRETSIEDKNCFLGYVQQAFSNLNLDPAQDLVYLCGNPSMIDEAFILLQNQQFTVQQIIREKYISR